MTYKEIKDAARHVKQREDPSMSNDPFMKENATSTLWDDRQQDQGRQPHCNQGWPQYGGQMRPSNQSWPAVRAVNLEDPWGDSPDCVDDSNLEDGAGDGGFDLNDYECADSPLPSSTASLLPPHIKAACIAYHYEQQEQWCYTCDETGHFSWDCPVCLKALKDKKGLNSKGALNTGAWKPPKQPKRATEGTPPTK